MTAISSPVGPITANNNSLPLHVVTQNSSKITLGWTPPPGIIGYEFFTNGKRVSNSWDATKSSVVFSYRAGNLYEVIAVQQGVSGRYQA